MPFHDVTRPISTKMPVYGDEPRPEIGRIKERAKGGSSNLTRIAMSAHTGTHLDAPCHFIDGAPGVESWPLEQLCGPALVVPIGNEKMVGVRDLERARIPAGTERVLFQTRNGSLWDEPAFRDDYVYIAPDAARWLVELRVRLVAIDYLSVEKFGSKEPKTHLQLLENRIAIVEGVDLRDVEPGLYELFALPIKLAGSDGAPARVILRR
ncbi:MAG: cyclase family protein [Planctomycetota bacterium]